MNWCLVGSIGAGILVLLIFRESYRRTDLDITIDVKPSDCVDKIDENFNKQEKVDADFIHKRNICAENVEHAEWNSNCLKGFTLTVLLTVRMPGLN